MYEAKARFPLPLPHSVDSLNFREFVVSDGSPGLATLRDRLPSKSTGLNGWVDYEALSYVGDRFDPSDPMNADYFKSQGLTPQIVGKICFNASSDTHARYYVRPQVETASPQQQSVGLNPQGTLPLDPLEFAALLSELGIHEGLIEPVISKVEGGKIFSIQPLIYNYNNIIGIVERSGYSSAKPQSYKALLALSPISTT